MKLTEIRSTARSIRNSMFKEYKSDLSKLDITSLFSMYVEDSFRKKTFDYAPDKFSKKVMVTNLFITEKACNRILQSSYSLSEKIALFSYLVELSGREFIMPDSKTECHYAASKESGYYFSPPEICDIMSEQIEKINVNNPSVLDPACGSGILLAHTLMKKKDIKTIVGIEIDLFSSNMANKLLSYVKETIKSSVQIKIINSDAIFELSNYIRKNKTFDFIIMNPPYGKVKFNISSLYEKQSINKQSPEDKKIYAEYKKNLVEERKKELKRLPELNIIKGGLEYSRIFLILVNSLIKRNGIISAITPSAWIGDHQSKELRKNIFTKNSVEEIYFINERSNFFEKVNQPTSIINIRANKKTSKVAVFADIDSNDDFKIDPFIVNMDDIDTFFPEEYVIPKVNNQGFEILKKITHNGRLKDVDGLINARGECDIAFNRNTFSKKKTTTRLIRGDHISQYILRSADESEKIGYINREQFFQEMGGNPKLRFIDSWRLACPQCSYLKKKKRVEFALVPPGSIIGNSANYVTLKGCKESDYYLLIAVLNCSVIEWFFRLFNNNNHVANYEIDAFPMPILPEKSKRKIIKLVKSVVSEENNLNSDTIAQIDAEISKGYKISIHEYEYILNEISFEYSARAINYFLSHEIPALSEMDQMMVNSIPIGGNWQNIPISIKSKRIDQIRAMSKKRGIVRTSYYGRLRPDQPAYTIATYFNRPGNGTNIHPFENRTLTNREAARLQSFPDSFTFLGSDGDIRNQIGNAVPPLLGYSLGKLFKKEICVDLFSGAGGLSYGFEQAGNKVLVGQDIDESALITFSYNHPDSSTILGDITSPEIQKELIQTVKEKLNGRRLGVLMGGPPCQGFSTAGWRLTDDKRNSLVKYFLNCVHELKPKYVIIENVPGVLSMDSGRVVSSIQKTLKMMNYDFYEDPWFLKAEQFGVPQMRRRVIIVASANGFPLPKEPIPLFNECKGRREREPDKKSKSYPTTVAEALFELPKLAKGKSIFSENELYSLLMRGKITFQDYYDQISQKNSLLSF